MNFDEEEPPSLVDVDGNQEENVISESKPIKVPITIVTGKSLPAHHEAKLTHETGYLGAGKTTLMNYILNEQHGKKIAVILNGNLSSFTHRIELMYSRVW